MPVGDESVTFTDCFREDVRIDKVDIQKIYEAKEYKVIQQESYCMPGEDRKHARRILDRPKLGILVSFYVDRIYGYFVQSEP